MVDFTTPHYIEVLPDFAIRKKNNFKRRDAEIFRQRGRNIKELFVFLCGSLRKVSVFSMVKMFSL